MNGHTLERMNMRDPGVLVLADGSVFEGELFGAPTPAASGEIVFNTALSGYQEILTDPATPARSSRSPTRTSATTASTHRLRGRRLHCRGVVVRELARRPINRRSQADLDAMLVRYGVPGITGIGAFGPAARPTYEVQDMASSMNSIRDDTLAKGTIWIGNNPFWLQARLGRIDTKDAARCRAPILISGASAPFSFQRARRSHEGFSNSTRNNWSDHRLAASARVS